MLVVMGYHCPLVPRLFSFFPFSIVYRNMLVHETSLFSLNIVMIEVVMCLYFVSVQSVTMSLASANLGQFGCKASDQTLNCSPSPLPFQGHQHNIHESTTSHLNYHRKLYVGLPSTFSGPACGMQQLLDSSLRQAKETAPQELPIVLVLGTNKKSLHFNFQSPSDWYLWHLQELLRAAESWHWAWGDKPDWATPFLNALG